MQVIKILGIVAVCLGVVVMTGCGKKSDQDESARSAEAVREQAPVTEEAAPDYVKMAEENRKALTEMNKGKDIQSVPAATLKAFLPTELPGMKRTNATGERTQSMGIDMSSAEGEYSAADGSDADVRIKLMDTGNMSESMRMGMIWLTAEYSRETDTGYEKTTTINGCKGMEKYDTQNKEGSIQILVADRFIVDVQGYNTTMEAIKKAVDQIDLKKLAASGS